MRRSVNSCNYCRELDNLKFLLEQRLDINQPSLQGGTTFSRALQYEKHDAVRIRRSLGDLKDWLLPEVIISLTEHFYSLEHNSCLCTKSDHRPPVLLVLWHYLGCCLPPSGDPQNAVIS